MSDALSKTVTDEILAELNGNDQHFIVVTFSDNDASGYSLSVEGVSPEQLAMVAWRLNHLADDWLAETQIKNAMAARDQQKKSSGLVAVRGHLKETN